MKTQREMLLRLYDDTQDQIQRLQAKSCAPTSEADGGWSDGQPTYLLAAELKDLTAILAMLEAELAQRRLLRTLN